MEELVTQKNKLEVSNSPIILDLLPERPYDRHHYYLVYSNGNKQKFDNYMDVLELWYKTDKKLLSHVEVLDKKETKKKSKKGFK